MLRVCYAKVAVPLALTDINKDATFYPDEVAQREIAQARGDNSLEFMNLWRVPANLNPPLQNTTGSLRATGFGIQDPTDPQIAGRINTVPIKMLYKLRVWSKSKEAINRVEEEWLLWQYRDPTFDIYASILGNTVPLRGNLHIGQISDASQVIEKFADGRYYSIALEIDLQAYIFRIISCPYTDRLRVNLYYSINPANKEPTELLQTWYVPVE